MSACLLALGDNLLQLQHLSEKGHHGAAKYSTGFLPGRRTSFLGTRQRTRFSAKRLAAHSAAAGAALTMASSAEAAIIYSGVQNQTLTHPGSSGGFELSNVDINGDGFPDVRLGIDLDGTYTGSFSSIFLTTAVQAYLTAITSGQGVRGRAGRF